jgi:carbon-monoxide dehydrogenase medium subunit
MSLPHFEFHRPSRFSLLFDLLDALGDDARLMAGGTDLLPRMAAGREPASGHLIALKGIEELTRVEFNRFGNELRIGAAALLAEVEADPLVRERYPVLAAAISELATPQVRNKATVAGNLCNASPCADTAPPLLILGARLRLLRSEKERDVPLEQFFLGPRNTVVGKGELVTHVVVPLPPPEWRARFLKFSPRSRVDISAVSIAIGFRVEDDCLHDARIALGTVAPTPIRAPGAEALLEGLELRAITAAKAAEVGRRARAESHPITDFRATREYKEHLVEVLTQQALLELARER